MSKFQQFNCTNGRPVWININSIIAFEATYGTRHYKMEQQQTALTVGFDSQGDAVLISVDHSPRAVQNMLGQSNE